MAGTMRCARVAPCFVAKAGGGVESLCFAKMKVAGRQQGSRQNPAAFVTRRPVRCMFSTTFSEHTRGQSFGPVNMDRSKSVVTMPTFFFPLCWGGVCVRNIYRAAMRGCVPTSTWCATWGLQTPLRAVVSHPSCLHCVWNSACRG